MILNDLLTHVNNKIRTVGELQKLYRRTRKLLSLHGEFYCTSDVDRYTFLATCHLGSRGLISVFHWIKAEEV